jgi:hypothetical protein
MTMSANNLTPCANARGLSSNHWKLLVLMVILLTVTALRIAASLLAFNSGGDPYRTATATEAMAYFWMPVVLMDNATPPPRQRQQKLTCIQRLPSLLSTRRSGRGRYSSEHWVHTHPRVNPCDTYTPDNYVWGYSRKLESDPKLERAKAPRFPRSKYEIIRRCCTSVTNLVELATCRPAG